MATDNTRKQTMIYVTCINVMFFIALIVFLIPEPSSFLDLLGLGERIPVFGWVTAILVAAVYSAYTLWIIPDIRPFVFELSKLKIWAIPLAVLSGIIEEVFFRKIIMDAIQGLGYGVLLQTLISATIFAAAHLIWVLFSRDWRFILPVLISTFVLGVLLSLAYVASDRVVLPVIVAHIVINLIIEPGLLYNSAKEANKT
ncbi:CPBP family intramembrane glutamic endopeptidase [Geomicrobium sp. JCM 19038]|uniref:CPBP family intramembrane glutamic endopeptidase n=1 Tax=Geomicrobium sp. JCM 19038 TaxID=1460635 RepID=UPI00045F1BA9|nr:CPBP family intramembrane glutamic endopeptidase [Geomicrobium sp. JCM 19038]GAK07973.1 hypothetical protein JCM19038_1732 [Geomicrobium sp. JCM 19038]